jgi:hypothetical protein
VICAESQQEESLAIAEKTVALLPWHEGARRLLSWWEMNKFDGGKYLSVAANLGATSAWLAQSPSVPMSAQNLENTRVQLLQRAKECREIGLAVSAKQFEMAAANLADTLNAPRGVVFWFAQASTMIDGLQNATISEMESHLFLWIKSDKADYYEQPELFGANVARQFPSISQDVSSAGNCYASDNSTACVFHCMRVVEKGLHAFANQLGVPFAVPVELLNWQNIIDPIEKEISHREKTLPKGTAKAEELKFLSGAAIQFRYFKEAWRNHVAHSRVTYDDIEALRIMSHVHQFMEELATHGLSEVP